jgi:hypothetical protein
MTPAAIREATAAPTAAEAMARADFPKPEVILEAEATQRAE